jgi:DNA-binding MarR family transcriptional regulator
MTSQDKINNYTTVMEFLLKAKHQLMSVGAEFGLTGVQSMALVLIKPDMPSPMNNLCSFFACDASNMTGIIDGLEQKGVGFAAGFRQRSPHQSSKSRKSRY